MTKTTTLSSTITAPSSCNDVALNIKDDDLLLSPSHSVYSKGVIFDFAGPYTIGRDAFAFGAPTRYLQCQVEPEAVAEVGSSGGCRMQDVREENAQFVL
ncbi:unnamed protein product [Peronospora destructor]|uniref:Hedgehog/Intein (Hint) domain-containing protein n=1 Tax=Peronospora destructor TaxID=86335 RepID=A0AAV0U576_9STRA|nr:unnamed protein product [Peronospora destructor]